MNLMSYYDPATDKILNCEKGSYAYAHEERHRAQYKSGIAEKIDKLSVWCYYVAFVTGPLGLLFGGFTGMLLGVGAAMTPHVAGVLLLEVDAYVIGYLNYRRDLKS